MGGAMSGYRWHKKRTVESCHALDATDLKRLGLLAADGVERAGVLRWTRGDKQVSAVGYTIRLGATGGALRLSYKTGKSEEEVAYAVRVVPTGCHLGGKRWWLVCPLVRGGVACGRRARKLYLGGRYFGCRRCHALTYTTTQTSDPRVYAVLRGGLDLMMFDDADRLSLPQLGLRLKALTLARRRLGKRLGG